ncbi:MAG: hypothetical protein MUF33_14100 [Candidatus Nanopelagicales bacterium]|jgi:hypothetical protein|nr:hypothetical protein [Candidatus Nanopelagicales bacterium]
MAILAVIRIVQAGGSLVDLQAKADASAAAEPEYGYDRQRAENPEGCLPETLRAVFQAR